jgi:hypothetical protein
VKYFFSTIQNIIRTAKQSKTAFNQSSIQSYSYIYSFILNLIPDPVQKEHNFTSPLLHKIIMSGTTTYYGRQSVESQMAKSSYDSEHSELLPSGQKNASSLKRAAKKAVKALKEHHQSVNAAYEVYYGRRSYPQGQAPVWED